MKLTLLQQPPYIIGMPTETVYGLAARIDSMDGIEAIFRVKERPFFDPLIVHVNSVQQAKTLTTHWPRAADVLARDFWPGPLTLILGKSALVHSMITSGLPSVGIRMPQHPKALELISAEGVPLAAPSANKFGRTSPTTAAHVLAEFGPTVPVIDGGACAVGLESTVLWLAETTDRTELSILRPGSVRAKAITDALEQAGIEFSWKAALDSKAAPGQMRHHYMPEVPLICVRTALLSLDQMRDVVRRKFSEMPSEIDGVKIRHPSKQMKDVRELVLSSDPQIAAREFYAKLRELSEGAPDLLIFRETELHQCEAWVALLDRLTKASSLIV